MKEEDLFVVEIEKLNRRITVERTLDEFLNVCLKNEAKIESHHLVIKELMERYMSVIRSRNKVRRNCYKGFLIVFHIYILVSIMIFGTKINHP